MGRVTIETSWRSVWTRSTPLVFTPVNLSGGYFPGWGLPCSLLVHLIPVVALTLISFWHTPVLPDPVFPPPRLRP